MEITPVSPIQPGPGLDLALSAGRPGTGGVDPEPKSAPAPAPTPAADEVSVVTRKDEATGAMVTTTVDADTGDVIAQVPIEQVLDLVAALLEQRQQNVERNDHGSH
jgi:hypothetical protein